MDSENGAPLISKETPLRTVTSGRLGYEKYTSSNLIMQRGEFNGEFNEKLKEELKEELNGEFNGELNGEINKELQLVPDGKRRVVSCRRVEFRGHPTRSLNRLAQRLRIWAKTQREGRQNDRERGQRLAKKCSGPVRCARGCLAR